MDRPISPADAGPANLHVLDADLFGRQFAADDPENLDRLSLAVPKTDRTPAIEFGYNLKPPKGEKRPYVRCAHCKYPNHWRGYVMRCSDGTRFLVGKDCGAKIYGADFALVERDFAAQRTRQNYLRRLANVKAAFPAMLSALEAIIKHQVFAQFNRCREDLRSCMPQLAQQLDLLVSRRTNALAIEERVRDHAAEQRRDAKHNDEQDEVAKLTMTKRKALRKAHLMPKKDERPIYQIIERPLGQLAGGALFGGMDSTQHQMVACQTRLKEIFRHVAEKPSDDIPTRQLNSMFRELGELLDGVDRQLAVLDAPLEFFRPSHLAIIAQWASLTGACKGAYQARGGTLVWHPADNTGGGTQIAAPTGYVVPRPDELSVFRLAMRG